ncbi:MarR family winged helix-turn-helix transcriptional regulator [Loigolactobacillus binensis]|uniref:HTH-type transcriptional regulator SarZ n=1 Tax=Loigolactobacillus binensis TaxID=2559922 RepID=A0ABW3E893_9LACO|nr:MarR family transcriptional regulator [Loigolactobacillus binensis]
MAEEEMQLTNQLCFSVYNASRLFSKFYQQVLAPFKLTYPQYLVLLSLWAKDNQSLHELGAELKLNSNTLTPLLKRLEVAGWINRQRPENDRRQLKIQLTPLAKQQQHAVYTAVSTCISRDQLVLEKYQTALTINNELVTELESILS